MSRASFPQESRPLGKLCKRWRVQESSQRKTPKEEYDVVIESKLDKGSLTYGEYYIPGKSEDVGQLSCSHCRPCVALLDFHPFKSFLFCIDQPQGASQSRPTGVCDNRVGPAAGVSRMVGPAWGG